MPNQIHLHYINGPDIAQLALSDDEIIAAVEAGLMAQGRRQTVIEPRMHLTPDRAFNGHFNVLRGYVAPLGVAGVKIVGDYVDNYKQGLPSEMALLNLFDPRTGMPLAVIDATWITDARTGAVTAIIRAESARWQKVVKDAHIKAKVGRPRFSAGTRQHSAPLSKVATETCFGLQLLTLTIWRLAMTHLSTLEIPPELKAAIAEIAKRAQRPESDIAADAVRAYLQRNAEYLRRVRSGIEQADCGEFVPDQDMEALFTRLAVNV